MQSNVLIVILCLNFGLGNAFHRQFDNFGHNQFPFGVDYPVDDYTNRIWRTNKDIEDRFHHKWDFQEPRFPIGHFNPNRHHWNEFERGINERNWFRSPFHEFWHRIPKPDNSWEEVDVTGTRDKTFITNNDPWWKGPNICVKKKITVNNTELEQKEDPSVTIDTYEHSADCTETETSFVCEMSIQNNSISKTIYTKYECCHGFKRRFDGKSGCIEVNMRDLIQTMRSLILTRFVESAIDVNSEEELRTRNLTVFTPTNEAFEEYQRQYTFQNNGDVTITSTKDMSYILMGHAIDGIYKTGDFVDEQVIQSANRESSIRTNLYYMPEKIITANCARLIGINNYARNGVVHIVDRMLQQPTKTIADLISSDPQFSLLKRLLSQAGLVQTLRDPDANFTFFAPVDSAFNGDETKERLLMKLMNGGNCVKRILRNHLLPNVICTSALTAKSRTVNVLGNFLILARNEDGKLYVDGIQIVAKDIMATNGVIHIIDGVLLNEATTLTQALQQAGMAELLQLIQSSDMQSELDSMDNFTFFAPTTHALQRLSPILKEELRSNKDKLREILLYHTLPLERNECDFKNNLKLQTSLKNQTIMINQIGEFPDPALHVTAQCARVITSDRQLCGGVMHLIDAVIFPPKDNVMDVLEELREFSIFLHLLKMTGLNRKLREEEGPYTLFAPTDNAFHRFSEISITELAKDMNRAEQLLKMHILRGMRCCAAIHHSPFHFGHPARTLEGTLVPLQRNRAGWIWYGRARIHQCDLTAKNGVVHVIDKVLSLPGFHSFDLTPPDQLFGFRL